MSERCPLREYRDPIHIPEICRKQCGDVFTSDYPVDIRIRDAVIDEDNSEKCGSQHGNDTEISHEGLQIHEGDQRAYSVVSTCTECSTEYMETTYLFICPYYGVD